MQGTGSTQAQPAGLDKVSQHSPGAPTPPASATGLKHSCVYPAILRGNSFQTNTILSWEEKHTESPPPSSLPLQTAASTGASSSLLACCCHIARPQEWEMPSRIPWRHTAEQLPCLAICCPFAGLCHLDLSSLTLIQLSATLKSF